MGHAAGKQQQIGYTFIQLIFFLINTPEDTKPSFGKFRLLANSQKASRLTPQNTEAATMMVPASV